MRRAWSKVSGAGEQRVFRLLHHRHPALADRVAKRVARQVVSDVIAVLRHWEDGIKLKNPLTNIEDMIAKAGSRNVSPEIEGLSVKTVSPKLRDLVREREWLIYKTFGYDQNPSGLPTGCIANMQRHTGQRQNKAS